jgi:uncharacterized protein (TIGR02001 family)
MSAINRHDRQPSFPAPALTGARAFCLATLVLARAACAQTSADLTLVSEYSARGISLGPQPALQLRVDHDADGGWSAGAFASPVTLYGRRQGQLFVYGGRALLLTSGLSWDAGISRTIFSHNDHAGYHEFYAGLALERASARLSYSPTYYGAGRSAYLDLNGGIPLGGTPLGGTPLGDRVSLALHAGLLRTFGGGGHYRYERDRADLRATLAFDTGDWRLQAGLQTLVNAADTEIPRARALVASISRRF